MSEFDYDLLIRAGRIVCTANDLDRPGAVAVRGDRIVASGEQVDGTARRSFDFPDALLLPGLIDFHAHPATSGSKYGVAPDLEFLPRGVTTVLSQGDAGADNWHTYRRETIKDSQTRVRLAINLSKKGEPSQEPCFRDIDWLDIEACKRAILAGGNLIWGIAVNVSRNSCVLDPRIVVRRALEVAQETNKPLLYGMRNPPDWPIADQLALLRPGDVVTYIFRGGEWSIIGKDGRVLPEVDEARERGVLFDACHGLQSFSFRVAQAAISEGFYPDTISTDQYSAHVGCQPPHDLPRTMSKFLAAGLSEHDIFTRVGKRPAAILQLSGEIGTLAAGSCADVTVLARDDATAALEDCCEETRTGPCWQATMVVRAGKVMS